MTFRNFLSSAFTSKDLDGLDDTHLGVVVTALVLAAHADDNVTPDEKRELETALRQLPWSGPEARGGVRDAIEKASEAARALGGRDALLGRLKELSDALPTESSRERVYRMAILVNSADGEVNDDERSLLLGMAASFGIDPAKAQTIFYAVKHQAGVFE